MKILDSDVFLIALVLATSLAIAGVPVAALMAV